MNKIKPLEFKQSDTGGWYAEVGNLTLSVAPPNKYTHKTRWRYEFTFECYRGGWECRYGVKGFTDTKEDAFAKCQEEYEQFLAPYLDKIDGQN